MNNSDFPANHQIVGSRGKEAVMQAAVIETDFKMTEVWCGGDVCKHGPKSGGPERVFIFMSVHALPTSF